MLPKNAGNEPGILGVLRDADAADRASRARDADRGLH
jgi:hypothetical protein